MRIFEPYVSILFYLNDDTMIIYLTASGAGIYKHDAKSAPSGVKLRESYSHLVSTPSRQPSPLLAISMTTSKYYRVLLQRTFWIFNLFYHDCKIIQYQQPT